MRNCVSFRRKNRHFSREFILLIETQFPLRRERGERQGEVSKLSQRPLNPPEQTRLILWLHGGPPQGVLPNPQYPPAGPPQGAGHKPVARDVAGEFLFPKRTVAGGLGSVLGTAMPETAVHKHREPRLPENKIRTNTKGRARHSVRAAFGRQTPGAQGTARPTSNLDLSAPAGDFVPPK